MTTPNAHRLTVTELSEIRKRGENQDQWIMVRSDVPQLLGHIEALTEENKSLLNDKHTSDMRHKDEFKRAEKFQEVLRSIEWISHGHFCPVCAAAKCSPHANECQIGNSLSFDPLSTDAN